MTSMLPKSCGFGFAPTKAPSGGGSLMDKLRPVYFTGEVPSGSSLPSLPPISYRQSFGISVTGPKSDISPDLDPESFARGGEKVGIGFRSASRTGVSDEILKVIRENRFYLEPQEENKPRPVVEFWKMPEIELENRLERLAVIPLASPSRSNFETSYEPGFPEPWHNPIEEKSWVERDFSEPGRAFIPSYTTPFEDQRRNELDRIMEKVEERIKRDAKRFSINPLTPDYSGSSKYFLDADQIGAPALRLDLGHPTHNQFPHLHVRTEPPLPINPPESVDIYTNILLNPKNRFPGYKEDNFSFTNQPSQSDNASFDEESEEPSLFSKILGWFF